MRYAKSITITLALGATAPAFAAAEPAFASGLPWWVWGALAVLASAIVLLGVVLVLPPANRSRGESSRRSRDPRGHVSPSVLSPREEAAPVAHPYGGRRILVAEDNLTSQLVLKRLLENLGFDVSIAPNGRRAVELFAGHDYAAILMDIRMPVMDGLSAARQIRETQRGRNVPIIGVTADTMQVDRTICREAGMDEYLEKPVRRLALIETLVRWVEVPVLGDSGHGTKPEKAPDGASFEARFMARVAAQVEEVEPHTIQVVADSYLAETRRHLERINHAMSQKDDAPIYAGLARLKSSSTDIGATEMADMSDAMAATVQRGAMREAGQILRRMWMEYDRIGHVLDELGAETGATRSHSA